MRIPEFRFLSKTGNIMLRIIFLSTIIYIPFSPFEIPDWLDSKVVSLFLNHQHSEISNIILGIITGILVGLIVDIVEKRIQKNKLLKEHKKFAFKTTEQNRYFLQTTLEAILPSDTYANLWNSNSTLDVIDILIEQQSSILSDNIYKNSDVNITSKFTSNTSTVLETWVKSMSEMLTFIKDNQGEILNILQKTSPDIKQYIISIISHGKLIESLENQIFKPISTYSIGNSTQQNTHSYVQYLQMFLEDRTNQGLFQDIFVPFKSCEMITKGMLALIIELDQKAFPMLLGTEFNKIKNSTLHTVRTTIVKNAPY